MLSTFMEKPQKSLFFQNDPSKIGPGAPNPSEGVLANFFNSLLSKKTGQTGFQPGQGGAQIKPPTGTEDCKKISLSLLR